MRDLQKDSWKPIQPEATWRNLLYEMAARIRYDLDERGLLYTIKYILVLLFGLVTYPLYRSRHATFSFRGKTFEYIYHWYNITHVTERCVELPIIKDELESASPETTLELGNVTSHYFPVRHTVVDKYEENIGVLNVDVMDYETERRFDLIISISTMEHIGCDERPQDPDGTKKAMKKLINLLNPGGKIVITIPMGYNRYLDEQIRNGDFPFTEMYCMMRGKDMNVWQQEDCQRVTALRYTEPMPYAMGIIVIVYRKQQGKD